jgi:hypothetical protein
VVRITGSQIRLTEDGPVLAHYVCSGEVIAPTLVLTVNHCVSEDMLIDGMKSDGIVRVDLWYDLALIRVHTGKPSLPLRDTPLTRFEPLTAIGYAEGFNTLTALEVKPVILNFTPDLTHLAPGIFTIPGYLGGMSGGPVVDANGEMVSICQRHTDEGLGYGVGMLIIHAFMLGVGP